MIATSTINTKVRGTTFKDFDWELIEEGDWVSLEREPENPHDGNAIRVMHPAGQLGYIGRGLAEQLADLMDAGATATAVITALTGGANFNRGINLQLEVQCHHWFELHTA